MKNKDSSPLQVRTLIAQTESLLAARERALFASHGLCTSDLAILRYLQKKGPKSVNQIAPKVGLTSGSMTTATQRLRKREFVTTSRNEKDGRRVSVEITKTGKQSLRALTSEREKLFEPILKNFSDREAKILTGLLKKINKAQRVNS